jgi:hypothetical protein
MKSSTSARSLYPILIAVAALNSLLTNSPASAAPDLSYNGANTYKDSKDNIYKIGGGGEYTFKGVNVTKAVTADACGYAKVSFAEFTATTPTAITVGGNSITLASLSKISGRKTPFKCNAGVVAWESYYGQQTGAFVHSHSNANGSITTTTVYLSPSETGGANKQVALAYTADLTANFKENTCGFVVFPGYASRRTSSAVFKGSTAINVASLPVNPNPPKCVNNQPIVASGNASQGGVTMYRTKSAIYLTGLTAGSINTVDYNTLESKSFQNKSTCGLIHIDLKQVAPATIKVAGTTYTPSTMPATAYNNSSNFSCSSPNFAAIGANQLYKYNDSSFYYKASDLTTKRIGVEIPAVVNKKIPVNKCGFTTIPSLNRAEGFTTGDRVMINGSTPYNPLTLPLVANAPQCSNGVTYTPQ